MKSKKIILKPLTIVSLTLLLVVLILIGVFVKKSRFVDNQVFNPEQILDQSKEIINDKDFGPRDPNLNNEQNLIKDYIASHLSDISPTKEVLGGKFYLTKIDFQENNQAIIDYEDGHIALQAEVTYEINPKQLNIIEFKILKEN